MGASFRGFGGNWALIFGGVSNSLSRLEDGENFGVGGIEEPVKGSSEVMGKYPARDSLTSFKIKAIYN